jgi:hypothetical protein
VVQSMAWQRTCTTHTLLVDNASADVLLGMLPFARELVKLGTQVRRCSRSGGALHSVQVEDLHSTCSVC